MNKMKSTQGIMINVKDDINQFIGENMDKPIFKLYTEVYEKIKYNIEQMAYLEEIILQEKCLNVTTDKLKVKLSFLREYVYARCPFYRRNKSTKDIRIIVSRIDIIDPTNPNPSLDELYSNESFMNRAKTKLIEAMMDEFANKTKAYYNTYQ